MTGKLRSLMIACFAALLWFLGALAVLSPAAASAQDLGQSFTLHKEPRVLGEVLFEDGDGNALSLADFHGKAIVLNIWATWCPPCVREMPTLDRLQGILGGASFEVVALSIDRAGLDVVREFFDEVGVEHLAIYIDSSGKVTGTLGVAGLPTTLLVDRNGREIARLLGPAEWDTPEMMTFLKSHLIDQGGEQGSRSTVRTAGNLEGPLLGRLDAHAHGPLPLTFQLLEAPYRISLD